MPFGDNKPRVDRITELSHRINQLLLDKPGLTIAAAESCSGGGIAGAITAISGSSDYFLGSVVAYVNAAKHDLLRVPSEILETRGAVSPECAIAMANGSRAVFHSSIAVSTTGIAGPTGATAHKSVGLVYLALATDIGTSVEEHHFSGDRLAVTQAAIERGLILIVEHIESVHSI